MKEELSDETTREIETVINKRLDYDIKIETLTTDIRFDIIDITIAYHAKRFDRTFLITRFIQIPFLMLSVRDPWMDFIEILSKEVYFYETNDEGDSPLQLQMKNSTKNKINTYFKD